MSAAGRFSSAYCAKHRCPVEAFESRVFWRCLYRHALPVAGLIRLFRPDYFTDDLRTIRQLGQVRNAAEFRQEVDAFGYLNRRHGGWDRRRLRIRVSGKRLMSLMSDVLPEWAAGMPGQGAGGASRERTMAAPATGAGQ
jgi:hypothetical protein